jgi:hypothetical protein
MRRAPSRMVRSPIPVACCFSAALLLRRRVRLLLPSSVSSTARFRRHRHRSRSSNHRGAASSRGIRRNGTLWAPAAAGCLRPGSASEAGASVAGGQGRRASGLGEAQSGTKPAATPIPLEAESAGSRGRVRRSGRRGGADGAPALRAAALGGELRRETSSVRRGCAKYRGEDEIRTRV